MKRVKAKKARAAIAKAGPPIAPPVPDLTTAGQTVYSSAPPRTTEQANPNPKFVLGTAGTPAFGGFLTTPEKSPNLVGVTRFKTFSELQYNCDIVATALRYVNTLIKGTGWHVQPAKDSGAEGDKIAEAVDSILLRPRAFARPWNKVVVRQSQAEWQGFAISEWTAKVRDDGLIGFADIQPRPQSTIWRWDIQTDGTLLGVWQLSPWTFQEIYLPRAKCIYTVDGDFTDSPDGTGRLRHVTETARQLKRLEQIEGWSYELDMAGMPVGRVPMTLMNEMIERNQITEANAKQFVQGVQDFLSNHVLTPGRGLLLESAPFPNPDGSLSSSKMFDLEVISTQIGGLPHMHVAIDRKVRQIARILGIGALLVGDGSRGGAGSFALSKDKTMQLAQQITSMLSDLAWSFDHDLVATIVALNGWDPKLMPTLVPEAVQLRDVQYVAEALVAVAQAGLTPDDPAINAIRDLVDIPHAPEMQPALAAQIGSGGKPAPRKKPIQTDDAGEDDTLMDSTDIEGT
jgi:hypothetical protein